MSATACDDLLAAVTPPPKGIDPTRRHDWHWSRDELCDVCADCGEQREDYGRGTRAVYRYLRRGADVRFGWRRTAGPCPGRPT
jgi:hypothetical protein